MGVPYEYYYICESYHIVSLIATPLGGTAAKDATEECSVIMYAHIYIAIEWPYAWLITRKSH